MGFFDDIGSKITGGFNDMGSKITGGAKDMGSKIGDPFSDIFNKIKEIFDKVVGTFDKVGDVFNEVGDVFKKVTDIPKSIEYIINFFKCPLNILDNVELCIAYYLIDVFLYIIYLILIVVPFGIIYCVILLPIIVVLNIIFPLVGLTPIKLTFSDICPFKNTFGKYLEFAILKSNEKNFFLRTSSDIDKCYCTSGIRKVFNPLEEIFSTSNISMGAGGTTQLFVFALIITGIMFIPSNKTEIPDATPIQTFPSE